MKQILWLPSWYPSKIDLFKGDFIQRHAQAAAFYNNIHVLYVVKTEKKSSLLTLNERTSNGLLTEDIVYYRSSSIPFFGKLFTILRYFQLNNRHIRSYIKEKGKPDYIHVHVPIKSGIIALWLKWVYQIPYIVTEHYGIYNYIVKDAFPKRSFWFRFFTKKIVRNASYLLPVSDKLGKSICEMVVQKPYEVVLNTVDTSLFQYTPPPLTDNTFIFLHASNMVPVKNTEGIIRSMEKLWQYRQDVVLWLTGPITTSVKKTVEESSLFNKAIVLTGEISYSEVALKMQQSHAFILFSNSENMPCVILESLCCGRPVIATKVGGVPEIINDKNGILIDSGDEQSLIEAMLQLITNYHQYKKQNMADEAEALYSYRAIGAQIARVYEL